VECSNGCSVGDRHTTLHVNIALLPHSYIWPTSVLPPYETIASALFEWYGWIIITLLVAGLDTRPIFTSHYPRCLANG
jgi:hypothetical protein